MTEKIGEELSKKKIKIKKKNVTGHFQYFIAIITADMSRMKCAEICIVQNAKKIRKLVHR